MSELVSMKMTAAETKKMAEPSMVGDKADGPRYPYGLTLHLDNDAIDKLSLKALPDVGEGFLLVARVEVTGSGSDQGSDKKKRKHLSLQITDCCLEPEAQRKAVEDALYGDKE